MTNEELDRARVDEAMRLWDGSKGSLSVIAARLAREGWTPPVAVDPDLVEAQELALWAETCEIFRDQLALAAIKRGRELERAEADTEIDQLQETIMSITEPIQAPETGEYMLYGAPHKVGVTKLKLKDTAKVKPGMVWVKHDGSAKCPVPFYYNILVWDFGHPLAQEANKLVWPNVTHYAIITQPEEK